jgi:DKNYY family
LLPACSRDKPPNSLFDGAGYQVRGDKVYFVAAFPGQASEIAGADAVSFRAFDTTYAKDKFNAYFDGRPITGADASSFDVLDRSGFATDRDHVYQLDWPISDDPAHFELLDGGLSKDSTAVYWTDGHVLSDDPAHFAIVASNDHFLFTKDTHSVHVNGNKITDADPVSFHVLAGAYAQDTRHVFYFSDPIVNADAVSFRALDGPYASDAHHAFWMGKAIHGADPATFRVLNAAFECSADAERAYYRQTVIAHAEPRTFPPNRVVTNCSETSISFAD